MFWFCVILLLNVCHCGEPISFCVEQVKITILWQPDLRTTQNEWIQLFGLLLKDFENDQCFELCIYNPATKETVPLADFERVVEFFDGGRRHNVKTTLFGPFHPSLFRFEIENGNSTNTPFLVNYHEFIKDLSPATVSTKMILFFIHGRKIEQRVAEALKQLQDGPQNYDIVCLTSLEHPLQFDWLPMNRLVWYYTAFLLDQFENVKDLLRNPSYDRGLVIAKSMANSIDTSCLLSRQKITVWALDSTYQRVDFMKLMDLLSIVREILGEEKITLDIKIMHYSVDIQRARTDFYYWLCNKRNVSYQALDFSTSDRIDAIDLTFTMLGTFEFDGLHIIETIRYLRNFNVVEIGTVVFGDSTNPHFEGYDNVIATGNELVNSNDFLKLFFQRFNEVACWS